MGAVAAYLHFSRRCGSPRSGVGRSRGLDLRLGRRWRRRLGRVDASARFFDESIHGGAGMCPEVEGGSDGFLGRFYRLFCGSYGGSCRGELLVHAAPEPEVISDFYRDCNIMADTSDTFDTILGPL